MYVYIYITFDNYSVPRIGALCFETRSAFSIKNRVDSRFFSPIVLLASHLCSHCPLRPEKRKMCLSNPSDSFHFPGFATKDTTIPKPKGRIAEVLQLGSSGNGFNRGNSQVTTHPPCTHWLAQVRHLEQMSRTPSTHQHRCPF